MALEILQSRRGCLCQIVLDAHTSHVVFETEQLDPSITLTSVSATLLKALSDGDHALLEQHGVGITVAEGTR